jgi:hypothetical protein
MGFEDEVEQSFGRPCRWTDGRFKQTYELTSSIVPRGTSFHHAVELEFPPLVRHCFHAATAFRVQWNSVPSTQMRCMIFCLLQGSYPGRPCQSPKGDPKPNLLLLFFNAAAGRRWQALGLVLTHGFFEPH